jgi:hypothetical protein
MLGIDKMETNKKNVLRSDEARKEYMDRTFTSEGKVKLENFTYSLVELFFKLGDEFFPYSLPPVLGLPYLRTAMTYDTRKDLETHIKTLLHLLALEAVEVKIGEEYKEYRLEIEKDVN